MKEPDLQLTIKVAKGFEEAGSRGSLCAHSCPKDSVKSHCPLPHVFPCQRANVPWVLSQSFKGRRKKEGRHWASELKKGHLPSLDWLLVGDYSFQGGIVLRLIGKEAERGGSVCKSRGSSKSAAFQELQVMGVQGGRG